MQHMLKIFSYGYAVFIIIAMHSVALLFANGQGKSVCWGFFLPSTKAYGILEAMLFPCLFGFYWVFLFWKKFKTYIPSAVIGILSGMISFQCVFTLILCLMASRFFS